MRRIRVMGLAIVAMLAIGAVAAAAAQAALPEFSTNAVGKEFTATGGAGKLETVGKRTVNCTSGAGTGSITAAKETKKTIVKFKGCKLAGPFGSEIPCKTTGAAAEEIVTNALIGKLHYLSESKKEVGIVLEPEAGASALFAEFKCESFLVNETVKVRGTSIGQVTTVNKNQATQTLKFEQASGTQKWREYEEGGKKVKPPLNETKGEGSEAFGYEESAVQGESNQELKTKEAWEIKG